MGFGRIDGRAYRNLVCGGSSCLSEHVKEINDLNVFPIPDGDTGDNMLLTMNGGCSASGSDEENLASVSALVAKGMLLGARGNSGVILSQFFAGVAEGFSACSDAGLEEIKGAFKKGVEFAYKSVSQPVEGTVLTVAREATEYACCENTSSVEDFFSSIVDAAEKSLKTTPQKLDVLAKAGVVDSGGAGFVCIMRGMYNVLTGHTDVNALSSVVPGVKSQTMVNPDLFTEDSVLEFGYCTELLVRLQKCKVGDIESFDDSVISKFLTQNGESVVCIRTGSIVKLHVHTMEPYKILEYCQKYGEFITVKIENMMIQHNEAVAENPFAPAARQNTRKSFAVVAVASGEGITERFRTFGADYVIDGGQTNNPSAQDFIDAFNSVNSETIFVLPDNGNVVLAAKQAAGMYNDSDVRVIPAKSIGDGYAVLSMLDYTSGNPDEIEGLMVQAMEGVETAEISRAIRDTQDVSCGDYIGIKGKQIVSSEHDRGKCAVETVGVLDVDSHAVLVIIKGKSVPNQECLSFKEEIENAHPFTEIYVVDGKQDIYDYILVAE